MGSTWRVLGASWAQLGLNLGALGANLGETWALLGPTWGQPGRPRDHLGRSWGQLGRTLGYMDLPKLLLGCSWRLLGASWRPQGAVLTVQSGPATQHGGPKPSAEPILEASSSLRCQFGDALLSLSAPLGGTKQLRNNPLMIRATGSKSSRPNPMENQEDSRRPLPPAGPGCVALTCIAFGDPLGLTWRPKAPSGTQLGGPKRS